MAGSNRRSSYKKKRFESDQSTSDVSANIYNSMVLSEAWQDLTPRQQIVYLTMKLQMYAQKKKPISEENDNDLFHYQEYDFYFNQHLWRDKYHLCSRNANSFKADVTVLIEHGFIEVIRNGRNARIKSVYRYSDKWKNWKK